MIQAFHPEAASQIISVAGFAPHDQDLITFFSSKKVLQIPLQVGVGLCFESRPVLPLLADRVRTLCQATGYRGVFEAEFIHIPRDDRYLLIDFNCRYYGQMGFEIQRGLPQSLLTLLGALGAHTLQTEILKELASTVDVASQSVQVFRRSWMLRLLLLTHSLSGSLKKEERDRWRQWVQQKTGFDQVAAVEDRWPLWIDMILAMKNALRHPRSSWRLYFP
jgi:D-aspartate ligase